MSIESVLEDQGQWVYQCVYPSWEYTGVKSISKPTCFVNSPIPLNCLYAWYLHELASLTFLFQVDLHRLKHWIYQLVTEEIFDRSAPRTWSLFSSSEAQQNWALKSKLTFGINTSHSKSGKLINLSMLPLYWNSRNVLRVCHLQLSVKKQEVQPDPLVMCFVFVIKWIYISEGSSPATAVLTSSCSSLWKAEVLVYMLFEGPQVTE